MKPAYEEPYIPQLDIVYPSTTDEHTIEMKITHQVIVDENYPFLDKSFTFNFMRNLMYVGIVVLVFFLSHLRFGIKIEGRNILRKHRKLLKNGAMTVSNHIHKWDFLFVLEAVRFRTMYFPAWKENLNTPDEKFIRYAGGIPIPDSLRLIKYFNQAFDEIITKKKWVHAYPEQALFYFYQPIRPFKKGVFTMAHRYNLPVIPMAFSYRKPHFPFTLVNTFRSITGNQKLPMVTLRIGDPLLIDQNLPRKEAVQKLRKDCHEAIVKLAGITDNPYPAEGD
ncbi:MAG: 1-acyl-sn-glycerol-3-phosphate acyltransferase [Treponema sp.]|jgi:1-acyl-sn-glycerol-3-phosphate acyltransferase|nr:1-acyl-sn-glycerol-3-phosphate acyltransferase [Treponema sp.]